MATACCTTTPHPGHTSGSCVAAAAVAPRFSCSFPTARVRVFTEKYIGDDARRGKRAATIYYIQFDGGEYIILYIYRYMHLLLCITCSRRVCVRVVGIAGINRGLVDGKINIVHARAAPAAGEHEYTAVVEVQAVKIIDFVERARRLRTFPFFPTPFFFPFPWFCIITCICTCVRVSTLRTQTSLPGSDVASKK